MRQEKEDDTLQKAQYDIDRFSKDVMLSLDTALTLAGEMGHTYIGTEHLLIGMLRQEQNAGDQFPGSGGRRKSHRSALRHLQKRHSENGFGSQSACRPG